MQQVPELPGRHTSGEARLKQELTKQRLLVFLLLLEKRLDGPRHVAPTLIFSPPIFKCKQLSHKYMCVFPAVFLDVDMGLLFAADVRLSGAKAQPLRCLC